jgi:hypothetical protein
MVYGIRSFDRIEIWFVRCYKCGRYLCEKGNEQCIKTFPSLEAALGEVRSREDWKETFDDGSVVAVCSKCF